MEGVHLYMVVGGASVAVAAAIIIAFFATRRNKRFFAIRNFSSNIQRFSIKGSDKTPFYKKLVPVGIQLETSRESSSDVTTEFTNLREARTDIVDPLLGVLHVSQQTKHDCFRKRQERLLSEGEKSPAGRTETHLPLAENENEEIREGIEAHLTMVWASNDRSLAFITQKVDPIDSFLASSSNLFLLLRLESSKKFSKEILKFEQRQELASGKRRNQPVFSYKGIDLDEVRSCYLRLDIVEKRRKLSKEVIVARGIFSLRKTLLAQNTPTDISLMLRYLDKKCELEDTLGVAEVELKCCFVGQVSASFILEITRAERLPSTKASGGRNHYKIELFVIKSKRRIEHFTTNCRSGPCPEWKAHFTFDIDLSQISEYHVELMLLRTARLSGVKRLGKTHFGRGENVPFLEDAIENIGEPLVLKRVLSSPQVEVEEPNPKQNLLGLLNTCLKTSDVRGRRGEIWSTFEVTVGTLAYFQYEKSGGDYKLEMIASMEKKELEKFTSQAVPSTILSWNASFSFTVPMEQIGHLSVSVSLIRIGRMRKSSVIGTLLIDGGSFLESHIESTTSHERWLSLYRT